MGEQLPIEGKAEVSFNLGGGGGIARGHCSHLRVLGAVAPRPEGERVWGHQDVETRDTHVDDEAHKHNQTIVSDRGILHF